MTTFPFQSSHLLGEGELGLAAPASGIKGPEDPSLAGKGLGLLVPETLHSGGGLRNASALWRTLAAQELRPP